MYRRVGDAECALGSHATFLSPLDAGDDVAHVVQTVKDTCDVGTLLCLYLIHKGTYIVRYGIHAEGVETAVEHVGLDAYLVERLAESATRAKQPISMMTGAMRSNWSLRGWNFPEDCHISR